MHRWAQWYPPSRVPVLRDLVEGQAVGSTGGGGGADRPSHRGSRPAASGVEPGSGCLGGLWGPLPGVRAPGVEARSPAGQPGWSAGSCWPRAPAGLPLRVGIGFRVRTRQNLRPGVGGTQGAVKLENPGEQQVLTGASFCACFISF